MDTKYQQEGPGWLCPYPLEDEPKRLKSLAGFQILDTPKSEKFDNITRLASTLFKTEIAVVSLVDEKRQWFKSTCGLDARETPRSMAFCTHAILDTEAFVIPDAAQDERFRGNPLVTGQPKIRFYAGQPLVAPDGMRLGTLCIIDSGPRQSFSQEEKEILASLAKLVMDELELHRQSLQLQKTIEHKSLYLAQISHEIRTPLNGVLGITSLLMDTELSEEQHNYVLTLLNSAEALTTMVDKILDFSKIEAGRIELEPTPVRLARHIQEAFEILRHKALEKSNLYQLDLDESVPDFVLTDAVRLRQILTNLLGNSIKFTQKGQIRLDVRYSREQGALHMSVKDSGIGIPSERLHCIFDAYSQGEAGITRKYGGTGLGLHIVKGLVDIFGGEIQVDSVLGEGTVFHLMLPMQQVEKKEEEQDRVVEHPRFSGKILLVEDNPVNKMVANRILQKFGLSIETASSGLDALKMAENHDFDLILMDCQMPEMDGYEASRCLRERERSQGFKRVPIVALTANAQTGAREECLRAGMDAYVAKPVRVAELREVLFQFLGDLQTN